MQKELEIFFFPLVHWTTWMWCILKHETNPPFNKRLYLKSMGSNFLSFDAHYKTPVNRINWRWALCFPFISSLYNFLVMSHVTIMLPWVILSLCAKWLHQRAIPQCNTDINLFWKQLAMNLDCLKSSLADSFHDQPSQMVVWFIPDRHVDGQMWRGRSSVLDCSQNQQKRQKKDKTHRLLWAIKVLYRTDFGCWLSIPPPPCCLIL